MSNIFVTVKLKREGIMNQENLAKRIEELAVKYGKTITHTNTKLEKNNEEFFNTWFKELEKVAKVPLETKISPIKNDYLQRSVCYALLRGKSKNTVILIGHSDTVDIEDFSKIKDIAYEPEKIKEAYRRAEVQVPDEVKEDLTDEWIFGRGICDMKGGGAIEMALFEQYVQDENFPGSLLLVAVPDEENLSAGMRHLSHILEDLNKRYGLEYRAIIDAEPHMRTKENEMIIYDGSIGKVMPICLTRGKLTHVGQVYQGLNPISLLSEIVSLTDLNTDFIETVGNTTCPAPTWLYEKDRKYIYDVSLPMTAGGYMSVLPLKKKPNEIMEILKDISKEAFENVIARTNKSYKKYLEDQEKKDKITYPTKVFLFEELVNEIKKESKVDIDKILKDKEEELTQKVLKGEITIPESVFRLMEELLSNYYYRGPVVIWGMCPPYYPSVNNMDLLTGEKMQEIVKKMKEFTKDNFKLDLKVENYFTGICDLSYAMLTLNDEEINYVKNNLLMWNTYPIELDIIKKYSMSVFNIGPWGKDLHKYTERVNREDLCYRTPKLMDFAINEILN